MFASAVVAALVALPFLAQSAVADASCTRTYVVKAGDTCDSISADNNASTYQLAAANPGIDAKCNNLQPGSTLCLGETGEDCTSTYVVKLGDTCDVITAAQNVNSTMLYANNPQINPDCTNIYVGEVLCVSGAFAAPSGSVSVIPVPSTAVPAVPGVSSLPPATPVPSSSAPAPTPSDDGSDDDDDGDDSNIPFCDEL